VNNDLRTTSPGQSTHQDSVKKSLPAAHSCQKKILPAARCLFSIFLSLGHLISVSCLVYQFSRIEMIRIQILSDRNDTICKKQQ